MAPRTTAGFWPQYWSTKLNEHLLAGTQKIRKATPLRSAAHPHSGQIELVDVTVAVVKTGSRWCAGAGPSAEILQRGLGMVHSSGTWGVLEYPILRYWFKGLFV